MKAAMNGGLNLSVLDGWWYEGYNRKNGWAVGPEISGGSAEYQNQTDTDSLFHVLENQIVPLYYAKPDGLRPAAWIQLMREAIRSVTPVFNTERMVKEYHERLYEPAASVFQALSANGGKAAVELADWKHQVRVDWASIRIESVETSAPAGRSLQVGDKLEVTARVVLGPVKPANVRVQAYIGETEQGELQNASVVDLGDIAETGEAGLYGFSGTITAKESGSYGLNVRVIPAHRDIIQNHELRLITWAA